MKQEKIVAWSKTAISLCLLQVLMITIGEDGYAKPSVPGPIVHGNNLTILQEQRIAGVITNAEDGSPLPGVSVFVKGTRTGVLTDEQGRYNLTVSTNDLIQITYIGYVSREFSVIESQSIYNIALTTEIGNLEEVVVTGYSSQRRKDITGAVAVVDVNQIKAQPAASAVEGLQGKATGVQIVADGAPGSTPLIRVRGFSTINNNDPLYIVDGVPYQGKLSWLNQADIESMQVLKDAASASIYGSRANNGVVIITTRKGSVGPNRINLDVYYGTQNPRKDAFPKMMNPMQWAQNLYLAYQNAGLNPATATATMYGGGASPTLPEYLLAGGALGHNITAADADPSRYNYSRENATFYQITRANQAGTNWFDEMTKNAPMQSYQLSANGGTENATYAMSGGYFGQQGSIIHTDFDRFNIRVNTMLKALNGKLRIGENANYTYTNHLGFGANVNTPGDYQGEGSLLGFSFRAPTIVPVYDIMGNFAGTRGGQLGNAQNPVALAYRAKDNRTKSNRFLGNAYAEADIIQGLTARTSFGVNYENWAGINIFYPNLEFSEGSNNNGMSESQGYNAEWTWTNTLNYNLNIDDQHLLNVVAGTEAINYVERNMGGGRNNYFILGNLDYYYLDRGTANITNNSNGTQRSLFSIFAKADYSFSNRYLVSLTARRDGSSNFGPTYQYGFYPAGSIGWRLSEEAFLKDVSWLDDFKIRGSYGLTGNQNIPAFQFLNRYQASLASSSYPTPGGSSISTGVWQNAYSNEEVKWEEVGSLNIGADFTLANGMFEGTFDWYNRNTKDMLYPVPLPAIAVGAGSSPFVNIGDMRNRGVELGLVYHYGRTNDNPFKFDVTANFSKNENLLVSLAPSVSQQLYGNFRSLQTSILRPGVPFSSFFGYEVAGIYQSEEELASLPTYTGARVGGLRYADINGDGEIGPDDRTIIGNPHPDFIYSLGFNASYKNFDISMFFNGSQGNDIYEATRYFTDFGTFDGATSARILDAWSPTNTGSLVPSPYRNASDFEYASSSYYVQDGSFFRMRNLQIGYTLPVEKFFGGRTGVNSIRLYATATNLFTITKYTGIDPEVPPSSSTFSALGVDQGVYPMSRQYLFGINIGF
ncbi:TonB-dependent receptor [Olivibacter sp. SDN3]|uniref:SusC/RagA family TonB-linked outer membrane protein n=1 Tax=Olivibacter sp. SDN3 TaxID=2764720 RepID=UPI001651391D|nr:TonB-dependent receptor [Olivibacter sp. SDN3]QNL49155.1 TonB-dependent receptor [Olivibacter sp. SDN3]